MNYPLRSHRHTLSFIIFQLLFSLGLCHSLDLLSISTSISHYEGRRLKDLQLWGTERRGQECGQDSKRLRIYDTSLLSSWGTFQVFNILLSEDTHSGAQHAPKNTVIQLPQPQMGLEGTAVSLETLPLSGIQSWGWFIKVAHTLAGTSWLLFSLLVKCHWSWEYTSQPHPPPTPMIVEVMGAA